MKMYLGAGLRDFQVHAKPEPAAVGSDLASLTLAWVQRIPCPEPETQMGRTHNPKPPLPPPAPTPLPPNPVDYDNMPRSYLVSWSWVYEVQTLNPKPP